MNYFSVRDRVRALMLLLSAELLAVVGFGAQALPATQTPTPMQKFIYMINPEVRPNTGPFSVLFVDLFDTSASKIASYRNSGKTVICYFSAGSAENWRSDYGKFSSSAKGRSLDGWAGEKWVDYRNSSVRSVMRSRVALAAQKYCNGIDPDNIDGHLNSTGFSLKSRDQLSYISFLRNEAKARGLLIGLKNSAETASALEPYTDFAVVEECHRYRECGAFNAFKSRNKAIFHIEYSSSNSSLCRTARTGYKAQLIFSNEELTRFSYCN